MIWRFKITHLIPQMLQNLSKKPKLPRLTDSTWSQIIEQSRTGGTPRLAKDLRQIASEMWKGDVTPTILVIFVQNGCGSCERKKGLFVKLAESISYIGE